MKVLVNNWNVMRVIRLALGILVIIQSISEKNIMLTVAGGLFAFLALINVGCCGANGCAVNSRENKSNLKEEAVYEEVDLTK